MSIEENRFLPWSGRRFKVSQYGKVINEAGLPVSTFDMNGALFVEITWVGGKKAYPVGLLVLLAFGRLKLPDHLLNEVEVLHVDGDRNNLTPANLFYRFRNGPLAVEEYPGFYYIPMYADYAISESGELINISTGRRKVWSVTASGGPKNQTGGYLYNRVINDEGFSKVLFLHRAICMVFLPYGNNLFDLVVNHKDGNPSNNRLTNLEWSTYRENNIHAYATGLRPNASKSVLAKNLQTGEIKKFNSLSSCAKHFGHNTPEFIRHRLEKTPTKVYPDMLLFKYDDEQMWPEINPDKIEICRLGHGGDIVARNIFTGETLTFTGTPTGSKLTGVKAATILRHVRDNTPIPVSGYNFRYLEFAKDWPKHTARHLQIYEKYPIYPPDGANMVYLDKLEDLLKDAVAIHEIVRHKVND
jgi:hypothetical protein